mmetsp:Transcript_140610/g.437318  ORF Transcript_140610/g.437318 Transcript_140610/m.437318 type:complete len:324 (-) Transcript_140610:47-1018(-)
MLLFGLVLAFLSFCNVAAIRLTPSRDLPLGPKGNTTSGNSTDFTGSFKDVLLVVHCRVGKAKDEFGAEKICAMRKPLYDGFKKYFKDVVFMTRKQCTADDRDPHECIADIARASGNSIRGIFYMHFDALIHVRNLAKFFDPSAIYAFRNRPFKCNISKSFVINKTCHSRMPWFSRTTAKAYVEAVESLRKHSSSKYGSLDPWSYVMDNDDMFYLPREVLPAFVVLSGAFRHVFHEVAGPVMRQILSKSEGVPYRSLYCPGGGTSPLGAGWALSADFRCGHVFDLSKYEIRHAFQTVISHRSTGEDILADQLEAARELIRQALA